jgi:hypothetical protein
VTFIAWALCISSFALFLMLESCCSCCGSCLDRQVVWGWCLVGFGRVGGWLAAACNSLARAFLLHWLTLAIWSFATCWLACWLVFHHTCMQCCLCARQPTCCQHSSSRVFAVESPGTGRMLLVKTWARASCKGQRALIGVDCVRAVCNKGFGRMCI